MKETTVTMSNAVKASTTTVLGMDFLEANVILPGGNS
jgi:hypothetical protein